MSEFDGLREQIRDALAQVAQVTDRLRAEGTQLEAELEAERSRLRDAREDATAAYAHGARGGEAGRARQELQRRIDDEVTTWRAVVTGGDDHWSAREVRDEIARDARAELDRIELTDPGAAQQYRSHARLREGLGTGEWR